MTDDEFDALLRDETKRIEGDIIWEEDEDHSPVQEFRAIVAHESGSLWVKGSFNVAAATLSYVLIHQAIGRIYALDLGKNHP